MRPRLGHYEYSIDDGHAQGQGVKSINTNASQTHQSFGMGLTFSVAGASEAHRGCQAMGA